MKATKTPGKQSQSKSQKSAGRGWHGDSEGHARAGRQSHKNRK